MPISSFDRQRQKLEAGVSSDFDADHLVIDKSGHILATTIMVTANKMFSELYASHGCCSMG